MRWVVTVLPTSTERMSTARLHPENMYVQPAAFVNPSSTPYPPSGQNEPVTPQRPSSFVGREPELQALEQGLEEGLAGRASFFLVSGEAGMGKTRLVEEATSVARSHGVRILSGRCWEAVDSPAYWPWIQILRQ